MAKAASKPERTGPRTSRVGKVPVILPKGVTATLGATKVAIKGPKGSLARELPAQVTVKQEGEKLLVSCSAPGTDAPRLQGLTRALVANMVQGVSEGYEKRLELHGTGYRAEVKGKTIHLTLGFSHPIAYVMHDSLKCEIPKDSKGQRVILTGPDKELVGQAAATIRNYRPPEPYGGKGVRYKGERVREKAGKAGSK
jgi:large subunit ribosomal protein L6